MRLAIATYLRLGYVTEFSTGRFRSPFRCKRTQQKVVKQRRFQLQKRAQQIVKFDQQLLARRLFDTGEKCVRANALDEEV